MITMAKGIGNGVPLGGMTTTDEIAKVMTNRIHFNTFGGNPVSMIQGLATLEVIDEEGIQQNALQVGGFLKAGFEELAAASLDLIGEVRGMGLMLGIELVRDRESKEPANNDAAEVLELAKRARLVARQGWLVR